MTEERIGVYVCHCGTNIASTVDVENVALWASHELEDRGVVVARDYKFMCSNLGQELIEDDIKEKGLTRVVVAACSPKLFLASGKEFSAPLKGILPGLYFWAFSDPLTHGDLAAQIVWPNAPYCSCSVLSVLVGL